MKCICCNSQIKTVYGELSGEDAVFKVEERKQGDTIHRIKAENRMWSSGVVGNISAGFGSNHDGDQYVIAICDLCIDEKIDNGVLAYTGNYMVNTIEVKDHIEKYRKIWRRVNSLDELVGGSVIDTDVKAPQPLLSVTVTQSGDTFE